MADFLHATDLGSDTDDEDYVPEGAAAAQGKAARRWRSAFSSFCF